MPPWVARQCHVWRSISQTPRAPLSVRLYTQTSVRHGPAFKIDAPKSAVIIPSSVADTRPEDVVSRIKPLSKSHGMRYRFAVFFVTPSFATWLRDDSAFLHKALLQMYGKALGPSSRPRIQALCAVVDKLPVPRPIAQEDNMMASCFERIQNPPVQEVGHEGIAYAALPFATSIPTSAARDEVTAAISFVGAKESGNEGGDLSNAVRLPLANTVFQTGSLHTMTYSTWTSGKGSSDLKLREKRDISHHGIRMQVNPSEFTTTISVPLIPLSRPRRVEASMGNILRRITGPDGDSITASQELEKFVPKFFSARGEPSQATTVWALVMHPDAMAEAQNATDFLLDQSQTEGSKSEDEKWELLWKKDPAFWNPLVPIALASGARLHRVLSGGGGWGKKAGLLSLDPVPVAPSDLSSQSEDLDSFTGPGDLSDALQQVAHEGDFIQFFVSPSAPPSTTLPTVSESQPLWGLELGTIPSTSDAMPALPSAGASQKNDIAVYDRTFGALAEGGMVVSRSFKLADKDSYALVGGSTIDVPFSRFSAVNWVVEPRAGEDDDFLPRCLEPVRVHGDGGDVVEREKVLGMKGVEYGTWKEVSDTRHKAFRRLALGAQTARDTAKERKISREVEALLSGGEDAPASTPTPTATPTSTPTPISRPKPRRLRPRLRTPTTSPHLKLLRASPRIRRISLLPSTRPSPRIRRISLLPSPPPPPAPNQKIIQYPRLIRKIHFSPSLADPTLTAMLSFHVERVVKLVSILAGEVEGLRDARGVRREVGTTFPLEDHTGTLPVDIETGNRTSDAVSEVEKVVSDARGASPEVGTTFPLEDDTATPPVYIETRPRTNDAMPELNPVARHEHRLRSRVRSIPVGPLITKHFATPLSRSTRAVRKVPLPILPLTSVLPRRVRARAKIRQTKQSEAVTRHARGIDVRKVETDTSNEEREKRVEDARRKMVERRVESERRAAREALEGVVRGWIG